MEGIAPPFRDAGIELEVSREVEWDSRDRAWTLNELHAELRRPCPWLHRPELRGR